MLSEASEESARYAKARRERAEYQEALDEVFARLERLERAGLHDILARLAELRAAVVDRLLALPTTLDAQGNETWQSWQLRGYQAELDEQLRRFGERYAAAFADRLNGAADLGREQMAALTKLAQAAGVPRALIDFGPLGLLSDQIAAAVLYSAESIKGLERAIVLRVNREIQAVVFGGQSRWDAVRAIRAVLMTAPIPRGEAGAKKLGALTQRAITLERTALISVFSLANDFALNEAADELPGLMREWVTILDGRADQVCRALSGKRRKPGAAFPGGIMRPPAHPRCRCRISGWMPSWPSDVPGLPNRTREPVAR